MVYILAQVQIFFIRQLLQGHWARTQQNLQNTCTVKTDQTARIRRLMSIFASVLHISFILGFMYFEVIIIIRRSSSRSSRHSQRQQHSSNSNSRNSCSSSGSSSRSSCCSSRSSSSSSSSSSGGGSSN